MDISMTARHCELDQDIRAFAHQRFDKLSRFARDIMGIHLIVSAEKYRHTAEITMRLKGHEMVSREEADDPRGAIDLAADHLEHQLRRLKEKRVDRRKAGRTRPADGEARPGPFTDMYGDKPTDLAAED